MDRRRLEEWYQAYAFAVHRRCARLLGSEAAASDALQEVCLRAQRHGDTLRDEEAPLRWLYRVADHHCWDVLDRRRREAPFEETRAALGRHDQRPGADDWEKTRLVAQVLAACSERVRAVAVAYYVDGLTQDEIAEVQRVSRKTVKEKLAQFKQTGARLLALRPAVENP